MTESTSEKDQNRQLIEYQTQLAGIREAQRRIVGWVNLPSFPYEHPLRQMERALDTPPSEWMNRVYRMTLAIERVEEIVRVIHKVERLDKDFMLEVLEAPIFKDALSACNEYVPWVKEEVAEAEYYKRLYLLARVRETKMEEALRHIAGENDVDRGGTKSMETVRSLLSVCEQTAIDTLNELDQEIEGDPERSILAQTAQECVEYEDALFRIAFPQKYCTGTCKCFDLQHLQGLAKDVLIKTGVVDMKREGKTECTHD